MTVDEMKQAIHGAANSRRKIAMFHLQVLTHAADLDGVNAKAFCRELGVPESYATEFTKMLGLAQLMKERGLRVVPA